MATQFLRNTRATLSVEFSSGQADGGGITVQVVGANGATVDSGTATQDGTNPALYRYTVAPQAALNRLTVNWHGEWAGVAQEIPTEAEVVGDYLFTVDEMRRFKDKQLADESAYPDEDIREKRDQITDDFQSICSVPFVPRYERDVLDGTGTTRLWLPHKRPLRLLSITVAGVALDPAVVAGVAVYPTGRLEATFGWPAGRRNIAVEWERGYAAPPEPIKRAARELAHYELVNSEITDRMVTFANDLGTVRLSTPGVKNPTGIPIVDATLNRYDESDILVAFR